ncbi:MAG: SPOR domain-containing protein [Paludibacteraceae bacterium]
MKKIFLLTGFIFVISGILSAQNTTGQISIIESIKSDNSSSSSKITLHQDQRIESLIDTYSNRTDIAAPYSGSGYRVQVFSSNNFETAKSDASNIERRLRNAFPEHEVYVTYASPFWKVRVGNFRTVDDAQKLRDEIIKNFPELRKDCYTVKESKVKIN